jgi:hypothetical protein
VEIDCLHLMCERVDLSGMFGFDYWLFQFGKISVLFEIPMSHNRSRLAILCIAPNVIVRPQLDGN